jgi:hypothetical protein
VKFLLVNCVTAAQKGKTGNENSILVGKFLGRWLFGRQRRILEDNIKIDLIVRMGGG